MEKIKTYIQAQNYLESLVSGTKGKRRGTLHLERIKHLLKLLGNPQQKMKMVHIVGTSGKGSTAYLLSSLLGAAGLRTGLFTSPHLQLITERVQINGSSIPIKEFVRELNKIQAVIQKLSPTYFEVLLALALSYFAKKRVKIAVIEAGIGGKGDATNIIQPEVVILTNIGLDHTNILGETISKITQEKVGAIKEGIPVLSGATQKEAVEIIKQKAKNVGAKKLLLLGKEIRVKIKKVDKKGETFDLKTPNHFYLNLKLSLLGQYQVENAALAITCLEELVKIKEEKIRRVLAHTFSPGRLEIVQKKPLLILDGAHSLPKIKALVYALPRLFRYNRLIFVVCLKKERHLKEIIRNLSGVGDKFILTQAKNGSFGSIVGLEPQEALFYFGRRKKDCLLEPDSRQAVNKAFFLAEKEDLICVTGSLYLVGEVREIWFPQKIK